jgi:acetyl-CoA carboxylase carboxyl transferase subunit beta
MTKPMPLFRKTRYSTLRTASKSDIPAGLWQKCKGCDGVVYTSKLEESLHVCPICGFHYPLPAEQRIDLLTDAGSFAEQDTELRSGDPLQFAAAGVGYRQKYREAVEKTGVNSAIRCGLATLDKQAYALGVMDFRFMGGSMGSVLGEKVTRITETATERGLPLVIVTASGGARMQEGMFSLMQMAKTSGALARHADAGLAYIVVMTHPTTAGVTASFASLGDVILAEPGALVGFAGARVIKQTTQSELPEGFQQAEFLVEHGFIDRVVPRSELRRELSLLLDYLTVGKRRS